MSKVTIPAKHYVGMVVRRSSTTPLIPLGFITPWGEDAAAQKRIETVDNWCKAGRPGSLPTTVIDNTPMLGFKMSGDIRRGMQGGQDKWRIVDPRGFELEITSSNLSMLLADTTIEKGEILDKCVWAREGGQNLLLTVESEEYIEAVRMTQITNSNASWKDVKIGNNVVLQNGISGRYLGRMHIIQEKYRDSSKEIDGLIESPGKLMHVILSQTTDRTYPAGVCRELHLIASPKLSSIQRGNEMTTAEAEIEANEAIRDDKCYVVRNGYRDVLLIAANPIKDQSWRLSIVDADIANPWDQPHGSKSCFARMKDGSFGLIRKSGNDHMITLIREADLSAGSYDYVTTKIVQTRHHYFGGGQQGYRWDSVVMKVDPNNAISYHHIKIELDTKAGNTVWTLV